MTNFIDRLVRAGYENFNGLWQRVDDVWLTSFEIDQGTDPVLWIGGIKTYNDEEEPEHVAAFRLDAVTAEVVDTSAGIDIETATLHTNDLRREVTA